MKTAAACAGAAGWAGAAAKCKGIQFNVVLGGGGADQW